MKNDTFKDYELIIYDGKLRSSIKVNRAVLQSTCPYFAEHTRSMLYLWHIPEGCTIANAARFIVFLYTRDVRDLPNLQQAALFSSQLGCKDVQELVTRLHTESIRKVEESRRSPAIQEEKTTQPPVYPISSRTRRVRKKRYYY